MNDTPPEVEKLYREMIMSRTPEERMQMAFSMMATGRQLILSSLPEGLSEAEKRRQLFERMYADELRAGTLENPYTQNPD
jgi:hypothetical protein